VLSRSTTWISSRGSQCPTTRCSGRSPGARLRRDGYLDLGGKFIEMEGVPNGMMAVVLIVQGQPKTLELTVYGGDRWDGTEHQWALK